MSSVLNYATESELFQALEASMSSTTSEIPFSLQDWQSPYNGFSNSSVPDVAKEVRRLLALKSFDILETEREDIFDRLTEELRNELHVSFVCLSFVDLGRRWVKSISCTAPADVQQNAPRNDSFCAHAIMQDILVVPDTLLDDRFRKNSLVTGTPYVRFYAGVPLTSPEGAKIGTVCLLDTLPRSGGLTVVEQATLQRAAAAAMQILVERRDSLQCTRKRTSEYSMWSTARSITVPQKPTSFPEESEDRKPEAKRCRKNDDSELPALPENIITRPDDDELVVELPPPETANDPDDYLLQLVETMYPAVKLKVKPALELEAYFPVISEEQMARYGMQIVNMARVNDVDALKNFYAEHGADALDCFNRFGEGLLNMACRRGFKEMVEFLLSPAVALNVRVRDDFGRTPLHDACWNPEPQLEICTWIMQKDPSLFLVADKRGFTPFQYARKSDWPVWRQFLFENSKHLKVLGSTEISETFQL